MNFCILWAQAQQEKIVDDVEPEQLLASGMDTLQTYSVTEMQRHLGN